MIATLVVIALVAAYVASIWFAWKQAEKHKGK